MTLSTKNILLTGGCSYTENWANRTNIKKPNKWKYNETSGTYDSIPWEYIEPFAVWPEIVSETENLQLINTAQAGSGNDGIFHKIVDEIFKHKDKIKLVVVMWSNWMRKDIQTNKNLWQSTTFANVNSMQRYRKDYFSAMYGIGALNGPACVDYFYRYSLLLTEICKTFNIKLIQCQGTNIISEPEKLAEHYYLDSYGELEFAKKSPLIEKWSRKKVIDHFIDHYGFSILEKANNFIDWPLFNQIGGKTFADIIRSNTKEYYISENDNHPNGKAHNLYALKIIDKINE